MPAASSADVHPQLVAARIQSALERAQAFAGRYAGKLAELDSAGLREAMGELAAIYDLVGRAGAYASLRFSTDTADPAIGALLQLAQERGTAIETTLLFFDLRSRSRLPWQGAPRIEPHAPERPIQPPRV